MHGPGQQHDGVSHAAPSVLRQLDELHRRLERQLAHLRDETLADSTLRTLARDLLRTVDMGQDVALACVLLNQIAGGYAVRHCIETAVVVAVVGQGIGLGQEQLESVTAAALTMNAAMLDEHDSFSTRDRLSGAEQARLRKHPEDAARLLACAGISDEEWLASVLLHHEDDDGSGYPHGLPGREIPRAARLLRLADRYCARVSARNYRRSQLPDRALDELAASSLDTDLAEAFRRFVGTYPPGTLVRLGDGTTGVVAYRPAVPDQGPEVHCLRDGHGAALPMPLSRRAGETCAIVAALAEDEADLRFAMKAVWGALAAR